MKIRLSQEDIQKRLIEMGKQISIDYNNKEIILLGILKGSIMFMVDLSKHITTNVRFDFIEVSSYGDKKETTGSVHLLKDASENIEGKHVLIVEDVIDTGITINFLLNYLKEKNPASLKICSLLNKPSKRKIENLTIDYIGFEVGNEFLVGYGLDNKQIQRNLPDIYILD